MKPQRVLKFVRVSTVGTALLTGAIVMANDAAPGTIVKEVPGGTITMTPAPAPDTAAPGAIVKEVPGGTITMTPAGAPPAEVKDPFAALPEVLASVGETKFTKEEFVSILPPSLAKMPEDRVRKIAHDYALSRVDNAIILELATKAGIKADEAMAKAEIAKKMAEMSEGELQAFEQNLQSQGMTRAEFESKICSDPEALKSLAVFKWRELNVEPNVKVTDEDIEKYYRENQERFKEPETVKASHILIKPAIPNDEASKAEAKKKAEDLLAQVKQGADLGELAEKESACPSGKNAKGDLGEFERGRMVKPFEDAAFSLKPGEVSGVVETQFGYHIIKTTEHKEGGYIPLDKVKPFLSEQLKAEKVEAEEAKILEAEKKKLDIKINI